VRARKPSLDACTSVHNAVNSSSAKFSLSGHCCNSALMASVSWGFPESGRTGDWVDYQVVRLYEDILDLLPHALVEVSPQVHRMIESFDAYRNWRASLAWVLEIEDDARMAGSFGN